MSIIQLTSACVYCGGVVNESHIDRTRETTMSCLHCGYQLSLSGYSSKGLTRKERGGYGTYHIHYKNGTHSYGCFQAVLPHTLEHIEFNGNDDGTKVDGFCIGTMHWARKHTLADEVIKHGRNGLELVDG